MKTNISISLLHRIIYILLQLYAEERMRNDLHETKLSTRIYKLYNDILDDTHIEI